MSKHRQQTRRERMTTRHQQRAEKLMTQRFFGAIR